jgi:hypothetical protein
MSPNPSLSMEEQGPDGVNCTIDRYVWDVRCFSGHCIVDRYDDAFRASLDLRRYIPGSLVIRDW